MQRVEEEVRLDLGAQQRQMRLRQQSFQLGCAPLLLSRARV
jgi:hypothetical protein